MLLRGNKLSIILLSLKPINRYLGISKKALFLENIEFAVDKKVRLK